MLRACIALTVACVLSMGTACAGADRPAPRAPQGSPQPSAPSGAPPQDTPRESAPSIRERDTERDDPVSVVQQLIDDARAGRPLNLAIDREFQRRLGRAEALVWGKPPEAAAPAGNRPRLEKLLQVVSEECSPRLVAGGGYEAIAIPPPSDDLDAASAAEVNAVLDVLRASVEVVAYCEDPEGGSEIAQFAIALAASPDGGWRALGWVDFLYRERRSAYIERL